MLSLRLTRVPSRACVSMTLMALALLTLGSCGSDPSSADGGPIDGSLAFVSQGPDVGLRPGQATLLAVRYTDTMGEPLAGARIGFAIHGDPRGSTLSSDDAITDSDGRAQLQLRAGASEAGFQVRVSPPEGAPIEFTVQISTAGFAAITLSLSYDGTLLQPKQLTSGTLRLYDGADNTCGTLGQVPTAPPARERKLDDLDAVVNLAALTLNKDYTIHVVAFTPQGKLRAWSCMSLPRSLLTRTPDLRLAQALADVRPRVEGSYRLESTLVLPKTNRPLAAALAPFTALSSCPLAPTQQLMDCVLDALDGGDPLDCVVEDPSPQTQALLAERGTTTGGCREDGAAGGGTSIEKLLDTQFSKEAEEPRRALEKIATEAPQLLRQISLVSTLTISAPDASGRGLAHHRLVEATVGGKAGTPQKLAQLPLETPSGTHTPYLLQGWQLELAAHPLSLRPGLLLRRALGELLLTPNKLPADSADLVQTLVEYIVSSGSGGSQLKGCAAISRIACEAARLPLDCLDKACPLGLQALAARLDAGFSALDEHTAPDLVLGGKATLDDGDGRLQVDRLGLQSATPKGEPGRWTSAELRLANETLTVKEATFEGR